MSGCAFIDDLRRRGLIKDATNDVELIFDNNKPVKGYLGFDPTASSLHVGHLVSVMLLRRFQLSGDRPVVLIGGATGMIGDPSFKNKERVFLESDELIHNQECIASQLKSFLDFSPGNGPELVNNVDWYCNLNVTEFLREAGKYITVNYMSSKESVKKRIEIGISFTEFTYQIMQAYDYYHLFTNNGVTLQFGGADQWGNITTGIELIRRKTSHIVHGITFPLITKNNGTKFGKTENGAIWLDRKMTSPYVFYQFWINRSDDEVKSFIKMYSLMSTDDIDKLIEEHGLHPERRILQKTLAEELTVFVHSRDDYNDAVMLSDTIFGNSNFDTLREVHNLHEFFTDDMCTIITAREFAELNRFYELIANTCIPALFESRGDLKRSIVSNAVRINKNKLTSCDDIIDKSVIIDGCLLIQKGNKRSHVIKII